MAENDANGTMSDKEKLAAIDYVYSQARSQFSGVPEITAKEVIARKQAGEDIVLVDVRTPEERATSMVRGAITAEQFESDPDVAKGGTVVCYCTIGGRAGNYTKQLRARGIDALNMPGAILAWSHAGGELTDANGPTKRVNTHSPRLDLLASGYEAVW